LPPSPARCDEHRRRLDTSVGVSGRYDFAVREARFRQVRASRPSHPALDVRDDAYAPLVRRDGARDAADLRSRSTATQWHDGQITSRGEKLSTTIRAPQPSSRVQAKRSRMSSNAAAWIASSLPGCYIVVAGLDPATHHPRERIVFDDLMDARVKPGQARA